MRRIAAISAILLVLNLVACKRMDFSAEKNQSLIEKSKPWFETYLSKEPVNMLFENANYHWDNARIFTFANGYKAVTVPVMEKHQNIKYTGRRILYLYPWKNGKGFYVNLYEVLPTFAHYQENKGDIQLSSFDGFILSWDLRKGYVGGAKYLNGKSVNDVNVTFSGTTQNLNTLSQRINAPLPTVVVTASYQNSLGQYIIHLMTSSGYSMTYNTGQTSNPCEYTGCNSSNPEDYLDELIINQISQELADDQWLDEHIKDSTNNPCDSSVIATLKTLNTSTLPKLFRDIFNFSANINITFSSLNLGSGEGGHTNPNYSNNNFTTALNNYYSDRTDLSIGATILHEMIHAQLMDWYRQAVLQSNIQLQQMIATDYHLYFDSADIAAYPDLEFSTIMNQNMGGQHQIIVMQNIRDQIAAALYEFALRRDPNTTIDLDYCKDMAWAGCNGTMAFKALDEEERDRLTNIIEGERGNHQVSPNYQEKGAPCN